MPSGEVTIGEFFEGLAIQEGLPLCAEDSVWLSEFGAYLSPEEMSEDLVFRFTEKDAVYPPVRYGW